MKIDGSDNAKSSTQNSGLPSMPVRTQTGCICPRSKITGRQNTLLLLDTQTSIHILHSSSITTDIRVTDSPVTVQGITGDKVRISKEGTIRYLNIKGYYSPLMTANIISYQKLRETHMRQVMMKSTTCSQQYHAMVLHLPSTALTAITSRISIPSSKHSFYQSVPKQRSTPKSS